MNKTRRGLWAVGIAILAAAAGCAEEKRRPNGRPGTLLAAKPGTFSAEVLTRRGLDLAWSFSIDGSDKQSGGEQITQLHLSGPTPAESNTVYAQTTDHAIYAIDLAGGVPLWTYRRIPGPLTVPPSQTEKNLFLVHNDTLYVFDVSRKPARTDSETGRPVAYHNPAGELRYKLPLAFIPSTPAASNDQFVAFGTSSGDIYSLPIYRIDEALAERKQPPLLPSLIQWVHRSQGIVHPPLWCPRSAQEGAARDTLIATLASGRIVKCSLSEFNRKGAGSWEFDRSGRYACGAFVHQTWVFAGSLDHSLYVLNAIDGYYLGGLNVGGPIRTTPVVVGREPALFRIYANVGDVGFCQIRVDDPNHIRNRVSLITSDRSGEKQEEAQEQDIEIALTFPRWLLSVHWTIPGSYQFVAEGTRSLYLFDAETATLLAVDPQTGLEQWRETLPGVIFVLTDPADPTVAEEGDLAPSRLVLATVDGRILAFRER